MRVRPFLAAVVAAGVSLPVNPRPLAPPPEPPEFLDWDSPVGQQGRAEIEALGRELDAMQRALDAMADLDRVVAEARLETARLKAEIKRQQWAAQEPRP
jgi:hypothetical protein